VIANNRHKLFTHAPHRALHRYLHGGPWKRITFIFTTMANVDQLNFNKCLHYCIHQWTIQEDGTKIPPRLNSVATLPVKFDCSTVQLYRKLSLRKWRKIDRPVTQLTGNAYKRRYVSTQINLQRVFVCPQQMHTHTYAIIQ